MAEKMIINLMEAVNVELEKLHPNGPAFREYTIKRYNGGWMKTVEGIDKTVTSGYSIKGNFVNDADIRAYQKAGLYLDCDKGGSRKHQSMNYRLFELKEDGEIKIIKEVQEGGRDWALDFWEDIEKFAGKKTTKEDEAKALIEEAVELIGREKVIELIKNE